MVLWLQAKYYQLLAVPFVSIYNLTKFIKQMRERERKIKPNQLKRCVAACVSAYFSRKERKNVWASVKEREKVREEIEKVSVSV